jgi:hypothetical protein
MGQGPSTVSGPGRRDEAGRLIPEHGGFREEQIQLGS